MNDAELFSFGPKKYPLNKKHAVYFLALRAPTESQVLQGPECYGCLKDWLALTTETSAQSFSSYGASASLPLPNPSSHQSSLYPASLRKGQEKCRSQLSRELFIIKIA